MQRRPLIAGNWKMHTILAEAKELAKAVAEAAEEMEDRDVMIAPPYVFLSSLANTLRDSKVLLAAQNVCWAEKGAFTGEISPVMLRSLCCNYAIIGHSERRHIFGESDVMINKRVTGAMDFGIVPVFCIGETLEERQAGNTFSVLEAQVKEGLANIEIDDPNKIVVAYEPVWAIGTGKTATEEQVQEVHAFLRELLGNIYEKTIAAQIRILYGGSVNAGNVDDLMAQPDVDGALVGGAALKAESFRRIIQFEAV